MYTTRQMMTVGVLKGWGEWKGANVGIVELVGEPKNVKNVPVMATPLNAISILKRGRKGNI